MTLLFVITRPDIKLSIDRNQLRSGLRLAKPSGHAESDSWKTIKIPKKKNPGAFTPGFLNLRSVPLNLTGTKAGQSQISN